MIRVFLVLFLLLCSVTPHAFAQEEGSTEPAYDEAKEAEIATKAKKRLYPGGRDEEDLKTQSSVTTPIRKVAPQAEIKEESAEE